jgi:hypothetical protein
MTDDVSVSELLVLRSTVRMRELARQFEETLSTAFPARAVDAHTALTSANAPWPGPAILWMQVHGTHVWLMRRPPPGIGMGR